MRSLFLSFVLSLFGFTLEAADAIGLDLFIGGGIGASGPNFYVRIDRAGQLSVRRTSLPIVPPGKLTESSTTLRIKPSEARRLIALAEASMDFAAGCEGVTDGTSAELSIRTEHAVVERRCTGAGTWPKGRHTKLFIKTLNSKLPAKFHVF